MSEVFIVLKQIPWEGDEVVAVFEDKGVAQAHVETQNSTNKIAGHKFLMERHEVLTEAVEP